MKIIKMLILSVALALTGCQAVKLVGGFKPIGTPIKITVDSNGQVGFELEKEIEYPTAIGTFSAGVVLDPVAYYQKESTLTVRIDCMDQFYDLNGRDFSLDFESGYYEQIKLEKRGKDLFLVVNRIGNPSADCPTPLYTSDVISNIRMSTDSSARKITTTFSPFEPIYLFFDINDLEKGDEISITLLEQVIDPSDPAPRVAPGTYSPDSPGAHAFIYEGEEAHYIYWPDGYQDSKGGHFMIQIFINGFKVGEKQFDVR
jgi:hypothetical protein